MANAAETVLIPTESLLIIAQFLRLSMAIRYIEAKKAELNSQASERLSQVFGTPLTAETSFSFELADEPEEHAVEIESNPVGAGIQ